MIELFKDRHRMGLLLASLFVLAIAISAYSVYSLPHQLHLSNPDHPAVIHLYLVLFFTFLIGGVTVWYALNTDNEVIVYRDKSIQETIAEKENAEAAQNQISLDAVKTGISKTNTVTEGLKHLIQAVCQQLDAGQGAAFQVEEKDGNKTVELKGGYALAISENKIIRYDAGEGLVGQAAVTGKTLYLDDVPEGYIKIISGLGSASPRFLLIVPVKNNEKVLGVLEIASFTEIREEQRKFVEDSAQLLSDRFSKSSA